MSTYQVAFARSARHELERLPINIASRILTKIENLADDPRPNGCKKLQGPSQLWRIRIGEYRVVYKIDDKNQLVDISVIRHRSDAYR
jgi:mRNA interferase RelE/StbE